jgi:osmotically-inducible protein OsmY
MPVQLIECESCGAVPVFTADEVDVERHIVEQNDLEHRIVRFLCAQGAPDADMLEVKVNGGTVRVRGHLPNRHAKWLCLECCRRVAGVNKLIDQVELETS